MNKLEERKREERIENEIIADCYNTKDQLSAWYYHLEQNMDFPFNATWENKHFDEKVSVKAIRLSEFEICQDELDMLVEIEFNGDAFSVPLFELSLPEANSETIEALADWHYWVNSGNRFDDEDGFY